MPSRARLAVVLVAFALVAGAAAPTAATDAGTASTDTTDAGIDSDALTCASSAPTSTDANISLSTLTAPGPAYDDLRNASAIHEAVADGSLAQPGQDDYENAVVAYGDVVLHRVSFEGSATAVLDAMAAQDRGSPAANFRALVAGDRVNLSFRGPTACPPELALNASLDADAIRVVPDYDRETLYLVFDSDRYFVGQSESDPRADRWNYGAHWLSLEAGTVDGRAVDAAGETQWHTEQRAVSFDAADDYLLRTDAGENQSFTFETTVAPGSELTVALQSLDGNVTRSGDAVVTANRTGRVTLDVPRGVYAVNLSSLGDTRRLLVAGDASGATLTFGDLPVERGTYFDLHPATTDGGFVVVRDDSGGLVGVSDHLDPGTDYAKVEVDAPVGRNQTFTATVVRDVDGDGVYDPSVDEPYRTAGEPVRVTRTLVVQHGDDPTTTTERSTDTQTDSSTESTTDASRTTGETPETGGDSNATTPGFGFALATATLPATVLLVGWWYRQASS